jgi:hypothetical protein
VRWLGAHEPDDGGQPTAARMAAVGVTWGAGCAALGGACIALGAPAFGLYVVFLLAPVSLFVGTDCSGAESRWTGAQRAAAFGAGVGAALAAGAAVASLLEQGRGLVPPLRFGVIVGVVCAGLAMPLALWSPEGDERRQKLRRSRRQCGRCGYDLRGLAGEGCPECGG